ncbi:CBO0543 family protein [Ureibacillus aquaedulcis]|uniref:CBO0543 family protein n=1 Tax=Ureibacillus aquaedulcis TaxID=3058421 RepID=A0ABT8GVQ1_9BACL|nr:CBO0543 family protein [Ureibacillus sp. BA0131]MDN4495500.1 CBO0543 family protein [Ureibacillus sp. BA0131]
MRIEYWLLLSAYPIGMAILFFIPKNKIRLAVVAFLFTQLITFLLGLVVVELGLLQYPVRFFASINRASFTYEYFFLPVICALFNARYPSNRSTLIQCGYYIGYTSILTISEILFEKYTDLIKYINWEWYITWVTVCLTFYLTRILSLWFFSKGKVL